MTGYSAMAGRIARYLSLENAHIGSFLACALVILLPSATIGQGGGELAIGVGQAELVVLPDGAGTVFVADPEVADVQAPFPKRVLVYGKSTGQTTIFALDDDGNLIFEHTVRVTHDISGMRRVLAERFPEFEYRLRSGRGSLLIEGVVGTPERKTAIVDSIKPFLLEKDTLIERISLSTPTTIRLRVRVLEVNRDLTDAMGINWQSLFETAVSIAVNGDFAPGIDLGSVINFLESKGKVVTLAEPVLTATSKESASFLAGGSFPYPVQGEQGVGVSFKPFGVSLEFTPEIFTEKAITLKVKAEVSGLSSTSVSVNGTTVPQTDVRQIETSIALSNRQTFALGGFSLVSNKHSLSQIPGLGDIPVLGKLFRSTEYQNNRTELVFVISPEIVRPAGGVPAGRLPAVRPTIMEYALMRRYGLVDPVRKPLIHGNLRLSGSAGYLF